METKIEFFIPKYTRPSNSLEEAKDRAQALATYLESITGVVWTPIYHENLGFFHKAQYCCLSILQSGYHHDCNSFHIMNSGISLRYGVGHEDMIILNCAEPDGLKEIILLSLAKMKEIRDEWNEKFEEHSNIWDTLTK